ncbi:4-hydroxy-tetrahydrodipicolinate reductase [Lewinella marina]|uniref:4-hydroxy-tetrahydrodipicolinate reductase n=1 Tax=Neolewinella marina TaxID=438751 RepID=A0A2G0CF28_9BACT|nr:dihydrodipicolinate reductase C-terminal domain-containing protein [Neolewinella marina]NJB85743.1 4-hydroxy-tetrahydrodipicolinate reductase [Neolewinella marina]PHK98583.1 4-hydroxy-tetrahydrodipicolinate reductase [Neolewinella marina]
MKIVLLGYGKMGRYIEQLALQAGHQVVLRVDEDNREQIGASDLAAADVAIEFSRPDAAVANIDLALAAGVPIVVGTTGWLDQLPAVRLRVERAGGALFYASNFSIGVNVFFSAARQMARKLAHEGYTARIEEIHHTEKLDAPSGTALTLQEKIASQFPPGAVPIESYREPDVPGTHRLTFTSAVDTIELTHTAKSREGFARGALSAAAWIIGKRGIFTMSDLLGSE